MVADFVVGEDWADWLFGVRVAADCGTHDAITAITIKIDNKMWGFMIFSLQVIEAVLRSN